MLSRLEEKLHRRRFEALVFKKNAGKYVGNYNYRGMFEITRRADLLVMADLGLTRHQAEEILNYVQRVLAINEHAGEKSIPASVKAMFPPAEVNSTKQQELFADVDRVLARHYGYTDEELDYVINYDVNFRMGRDGDNVSSPGTSVIALPGQRPFLPSRRRSPRRQAAAVTGAAGAGRGCSSHSSSMSR